MSPLSIRRYRAERLLRSRFQRLRGAVIATTERRLRAHGMCVDRSDLDAAYSHAWHGLYAAMLEGEEIANPDGWLTVVTYRRAVDEHRARERAAKLERGRAETTIPAAVDPDFAAALDDRIRLRQLMEGLRLRLSERELQAASLCYLQGLPRVQAAAQMGVSETAMRRLMDGRAGGAGVAQKVGALVGAINGGGWCAEQGSLMRGLAYGILDPGGERYRAALAHQRDCSACRSYVLSLRGLAAVLPPVPMLLRSTLLAGSGAGAGAGAGGIGSAATSAGATGSSGGAAGVASATGAAGGGWLIAGGGPAATKLAIGCLLAFGFGAGCVTLGGSSERTARAAHAHTRVHRTGAHARAEGIADVRLGGPGAVGEQPLSSPRATPQHPDTSERAPREFGVEIGGSSTSNQTAGVGEAQPRHAHAAATSASQPTSARPTIRPAPAPSAPPEAAGTTAAREFSPG